MGIYNIQPINEAWGMVYALNRWAIIRSLHNFLRNVAGGEYNMDVVPDFSGQYTWCPSRNYSTGVGLVQL